MNVKRTDQLLLLLACLLATAAGCRKQDRSPRVTINNTTWRVELATTAKQRYRGLSGRRDLPAGSGMLFIYPSPRALRFCMRDCLIPLDIAFISSDRRVIATYTMSVEPDLAGRVPYRSTEPAQFVLEVPAGQLRQADVMPGSAVTFAGEIPDAAKAAPGP